MNMFLHDFKTIEDYNDVAEWIKSSGLDPAKNTIVFSANLAGSGKIGTLLIGSSFDLFAHLVELTGTVITRSSKTKAAAMDLAFAMHRATCNAIERLFDRNGGEPS